MTSRRYDGAEAGVGTKILRAPVSQSQSKGEALATVVLDSIRDVPHYLLRGKNKVASVTLLTAILSYQ